MKYPKVELNKITREDVKRIVEWIKDDEVAELKSGLDANIESQINPTSVTLTVSE